MTTIIGTQWQWGCEISADGRTTSDGRVYNGSHMVKVVARGEYVIAAAGSGGACDFITHVWRPPAYRGANEYEFLVAVLSPHLQKALQINDFLPLKEDDGLQMLLAVNGQVFQIESDGTVLHSDGGFYGIGTGAPYALGAIEAGADTEEALEIASMYDIYTGPPFTRMKQVKP